MALPGICGPANRPCKISHVSTFPNKIGIYPSEFLPSTSLIWHAVFASQFPPGVALFGLGETFPDLVVPGLAPAFAPVLPTTHSFQSHHHIIFARTENRIDVPYVLTEADIDRKDAEGITTIDVGEFIFEAVAVIDQPLKPDTGLTDQETNALDDEPFCSEGCTTESEEDREFRKLFDISIPKNRLRGLEFNELGVEFRMDNGSRKSKFALDQAGLGDLDSPSYRDGSSRKLRVDVKDITELIVDAPHVLYFTYVAVKEHYLRQRVVISWAVDDPGTAEFASTCISRKLGHDISHFRFFEWDVAPDVPGGTPKKLAGWRIVESFSSDVNFVAPVTVQNQILLADFVVGGQENLGISRTNILSLEAVGGQVSIPQLETFLADRKELSRFDFDAKYKLDVSLTGVVRFGAFHENAGVTGANTTFRDSPWFERNEFSKFRDRIVASDHVLFNVHPRALQKRDLDKWGIERFLADEIQKDIQAGEETSFPFMDDPLVDEPTDGAREFLDGSNTLFLPVQPISAYGGNFEAVCGSIGTLPLNPKESAINSYHSFESNRITERFDVDTRVLVERNFAVNADILGPRLITIEGTGGGGTGGGVSCVVVPSKEFAFAAHTNDDNFITFNSFSIGFAEEAFKLIFNPEQSAPPVKDNPNPIPDQFEKLLGFTSMIGDVPGIQPGRTIGIASYASPDVFTFSTTSVEGLQGDLPHLTGDQIKEITITLGDSLVIPVSDTYHGSVRLRFDLAPGASNVSEDAILLAKRSGVIDGAIDSVSTRLLLTGIGNPTATRVPVKINFYWMRADTFELVGPRVKFMRNVSVVVESLNSAQADDFLNEQASHTEAFASQSLDNRLTDRGLFFGSNILSMATDDVGSLYVFFNDADNGISVVATNDFGEEWHYFYGIVEKIGDIVAQDSFVVSHTIGNSCFLFYRFANNILCRKIPFDLFDFRDINLVQRFESDIFEEGSPPKEKAGIFSRNGQTLRRRTVSHIAAGNLNNSDLLSLLGKDPDTFLFDNFEIREVNGVEQSVIKNQIGFGPTTAFTNADITDSFFSAYRHDNGELKLWFMGETEEGIELQCNFSVDDGLTWYYLWEFIEHGYHRLRFDPDKNSQFIDRGASGDIPTNFAATDTQEGNQQAQFGINIHWSRLERHKKEGGEDINAESQVLEVSSPYIFYQPTTDRVFLFYIYQGCLLCKVFNDEIFTIATRSFIEGKNGIEFVQDVIERQTRAYFIDGSLTDASLREEIFDTGNEVGNIIFKYSAAAMDNFGDDRAVGPQRVCAHDMSSGQIRVFYKHADSVNLKTALWTPDGWWAEDFLTQTEFSS